jgi:hypothetical protein
MKIRGVEHVIELPDGGLLMPLHGYLGLGGAGARTLQDTSIHAQYWHIGYPSAVQLEDGTVIAAYQEYSDDERPLQYLMCTRFEL